MAICDQLCLKEIVTQIMNNANAFMVFEVETNCYIIWWCTFQNFAKVWKWIFFILLYKHVRFYKFVLLNKNLLFPCSDTRDFVWWLKYYNCNIFNVLYSKNDFCIIDIVYFLVLGYALKLYFKASYYCFYMYKTYIYCMWLLLYSIHLFSIVKCIKIVVFYICTNKWFAHSKIV